MLQNTHQAHVRILSPQEARPTCPGTRDELSHRGPVTVEIVCLVALGLRGIHSLQNLAFEGGNGGINTTVDDGDSDAFPGRLLPDLFGIHCAQVPLLRLHVGSNRGRTSSDEANRQHRHRTCRAEHTSPKPADAHHSCRHPDFRAFPVVSRSPAVPHRADGSPMSLRLPSGSPGG